jgi:putative membrane protein
MMDYDGGMGGGDWVVMTVMMLALLAVLVFLGLAVLRAGRRDDDPTRSASEAERLLDERLARGEISPEEYRTRRDLLRSHG